MTQAREFGALPGHGVTAEAEGRSLQLGRPALLRKLGADVPPPLHEAEALFSGNAQAAIYLA